MAINKAKEEISQRHTDWNTKQINSVARAVAFGALKFEMVSRVFKVYYFWYWQRFAFWRIYCRILAIYLRAYSAFREKLRVHLEKLKQTRDLSQDAKEKNIIVKLGQYPQIVKSAGEKKDPEKLLSIFLN